MRNQLQSQSITDLNKFKVICVIFCWLVCTEYCLTTPHDTDQSSHPVSDFSYIFKSITMVTGIAADCVGACEASVRARSAVEMIAGFISFHISFSCPYQCNNGQYGRYTGKIVYVNISFMRW